MRNLAGMFHKLGSCVLILFAAVHTAAFFVDPAARLTDEESKRIWHLMQTHQFQIEGTSFNVRSLMLGFNWYLEIFTLGLGILNLLLIKPLAEQAASFRLVSAANAIMTGLLAIVSAMYFHLPPLVLFGFSWLFFLLAFFAAGKNQ